MIELRFFAWRNMRLSASLIVHNTKSLRCQMVPYLSSYEDVGQKRMLIWKQKVIDLKTVVYSFGRCCKTIKHY